MPRAWNSSRWSPSTTSLTRGGSRQKGVGRRPTRRSGLPVSARGRASALGDIVGMACTLNEPNIVSMMGYLAGVFPPGVRDVERRRVVTANFCRAHRLAVQELKSGPGDYPVGLTLSMTEYQATPGGEERRDRIRRSMEDVFLEATGGDDFVGVQTYSRMRVGPEGALDVEAGVPVTTMGYERWPQGLEATIRRAWEVTGGTPVFVTENGISTEDDAERVELCK